MVNINLGIIEIKWTAGKKKNKLSVDTRTDLEEINIMMEKEVKESFELFKKKNRDYNNNYFSGKHSDLFLFQSFARKYARLEQFYNNKEKPVIEDETILDTLRDLAIYSLMEIVRLKRKGER